MDKEGGALVPAREQSASSAPDSSSSVSRLEAENRELRRKVQQLTDLRDPVGAVLALQSAAAAPPPQYHVEQMVEGFWDGMYRARCGFRVLGLYETRQEALNHACLDYAVVQQRIQPAAPPAATPPNG